MFKHTDKLDLYDGSAITELTPRVRIRRRYTWQSTTLGGEPRKIPVDTLQYLTFDSHHGWCWKAVPIVEEPVQENPREKRDREREAEMSARIADVAKTLLDKEREHPPHPRVGSLWMHYKGHQYVVLGLTKHSETKETLVRYRRSSPVGDDTEWVRPAYHWHDTISVVEDGRRDVPRFVHIGPA